MAMSRSWVGKNTKDNRKHSNQQGAPKRQMKHRGLVTESPGLSIQKQVSNSAAQ